MRAIVQFSWPLAVLNHTRVQPAESKNRYIVTNNIIVRVEKILIAKM